MLPTRRSRSTHRLLGIAAVCLGATLMAACGSALDPNEVAGNTGVAGAQQPGTTVTNADGTISTAPAPVLGGDGAGSGSSVDPVTGVTIPAGGSDGSVPQAGSDPGVPGDTSAPGGAVPTSGGSGNPSTGSSAQPTGSGSPAPSTNADACANFKNTTGITDSTITIGNASDISGPAPGLFEASQQAVEAYVKYFNATSSICGRKLVLKTYDTKTDAGADKQAYTSACSEVFAMVGSTSAFDSGGAPVAQACGLPDMRSATLTADRAACTTCFGAQSSHVGEHENAVADYALKYYPDAAQHAAFLYLDAGASADNAKVQAAAEGKRGMKFDYIAPIPVTEFNYASYAEKIKSNGDKYVQFTGSDTAAANLEKAIAQVGYKTDIYMQDPTIYDKNYVSSGGSAVDGSTIFTNFVPFAEAGSSPEMAAYLGYLQQSDPSAEPTFMGVFAWSAAVLFTETAAALGDKLTRASMVQAFSQVKDWTAHGLTQPQNVGAKRTGQCWRFLVLNGGQWSNGKSGAKPLCDGTTTV